MYGHRSFDGCSTSLCRCRRKTLWTHALSCDDPPTVWVGRQGQASDIEITAREILKLKKELYEIIAKHSGQKYDKVYDDSDRDYWMKAPEAKKYGMIDEVLVRN